MAVYSFDKEKIAQAYEAAKKNNELLLKKAEAAPVNSLVARHLSMSGGCISVEVYNNQVCIDIPSFGEHCFQIPFNVPDATVGKACLDLCFKGGWLPTGVTVSLSVLDNDVISVTLGDC